MDHDSFTGQAGPGQIEYRLERSPRRRKTISVSVRAGGVIVRAPLRAPLSRIDEILKAKGTWIAKKLAETTAQSALAARKYLSGELFKFLGRDYPLVIEEAPVKRVAAAGFAGGGLVVKVPVGLSDEARAAWVRESLKRWYRPRAKSFIAKAAAHWAAETGLAPSQVRVKDLKRSWGICTRENISLNWRLVMTPAPLIEYVIIHELCHLTHKNHSPAFYATLGSFLPDYKERRRALKQLAPFLAL